MLPTLKGLEELSITAGQLGTIIPITPADIYSFGLSPRVTAFLASFTSVINRGVSTIIRRL
ncbi:hypothetical protein A2379_03105 [Candidatus Amesbacteria bacterium RIFOXYB1_FULL_47_13]|nr:MAG: hypothetical protein A2379_03105 [Candidatus Amesbacteria bacterium RIFOXYB1_FULL_47_13]HBC72355.1 hypothetical protein [Candidatus Amesbacteria bacterium]